MPRPSLREDVVAAAMKQFHRHGYQGGGVKDITNAAGLPKGSFYNYFASKEEMALEALMRYGLSRELDRLSASSASCGSWARRATSKATRSRVASTNPRSCALVTG
jgi:TetR/AcrR family transcriptional repressor of nem operon